MKAEFYRPDDASAVVGVARWDGRVALVEAEQEEARSAIARILRPTPVVVEDASLRPLGSRGEAVVQPGTLEWFRSAASTRAAAEGFRVRFVPEVRGLGGWDPASAYRTFRQAVARMVATSTEDEGAPIGPS